MQILTSGGSDWLAGSGTATKVEGGYKVNGRKVFASGAPSANLFMTMAVEQTPEGPTVMHIAVPLTSLGISIVETWDTMGMRGTASHDVLFQDVFVPDAAVSVRRPSGDWHPIMHLISMVAFPLVYAVYTGVAEAARDIADAQRPSARGRPRSSWSASCRPSGRRRASRIDSMVAFADTAQPGETTTSEIFTHRSLVARSALRTVELALEVRRRRELLPRAWDWSGCSAISRARASIRCVPSISARRSAPSGSAHQLLRAHAISDDRALPPAATFCLGSPKLSSPPECVPMT